MQGIDRPGSSCVAATPVCSATVKQGITTNAAIIPMERLAYEHVRLRHHVFSQNLLPSQPTLYLCKEPGQPAYTIIVGLAVGPATPWVHQGRWHPRHAARHL